MGAVCGQLRRGDQAAGAVLTGKQHAVGSSSCYFWNVLRHLA